MIGKTRVSGDIAHDTVQARRQLEDAKRFLEAGDLANARDVCKDLLAEHDEYVGALNTLGRVYMAEGAPKSALPCFIRASMLCPEEPMILVRLAEVYWELECDEAALQAANEALCLEPEDETLAEAHLVLGRVYDLRSEYHLAVEHLRQALDKRPDMSIASILLGECHVELGEPQEVAVAYDRALKNDVSPLAHAQILYDLASDLKKRDAKGMLERIDALEKEAAGFEAGVQDAILQGRLKLARAVAHQSLGKHPEAWEALVAGNASLHGVYSSAYDEQKALYAPILKHARAWNYAGPLSSSDGGHIPVTLLIVGATCSGKTTLERLVCSMEGVKRGFENALVQESTVQVSRVAGLLPIKHPCQLPEPLYTPFSNSYMSEITRRAGRANLFTTTHQGFNPDLGRIAELVPNVRIVFVERDVDDTAFRIFCMDYPQEVNPFAYHVPSIYEFIGEYAQLVEAWSGHLSDISIRCTFTLHCKRSPRKSTSRLTSGSTSSSSRWRYRWVPGWARRWASDSRAYHQWHPRRSSESSDVRLGVGG